MKTKHKHISLIIIAVLIASLSFFSGMKYAQSKSGVNQRFQGMQGAGTQGGAQGQRRTGGMRGGFVSGEILSVDSKGITIKLPSGGSQIILLSSSTSIMKSTPGSQSDLIVGSNIMITGSANQDGSLTASSVQIRP